MTYHLVSSKHPSSLRTLTLGEDLPVLVECDGRNVAGVIRAGTILDVADAVVHELSEPAKRQPERTGER